MGSVREEDEGASQEPLSRAQRTASTASPPKADLETPRLLVGIGGKGRSDEREEVGKNFLEKRSAKSKDRGAGQKTRACAEPRASESRDTC